MLTAARLKAEKAQEEKDRGMKIGKHYRARSACLEEFATRFGRMPLVHGHQFVTQMGAWDVFKAPSSWLEYLSNPF